MIRQGILFKCGLNYNRIVDIFVLMLIDETYEILDKKGSKKICKKGIMCSKINCTDHTPEELKIIRTNNKLKYCIGGLGCKYKDTTCVKMHVDKEERREIVKSMRICSKGMQCANEKCTKTHLDVETSAKKVCPLGQTCAKLGCTNFHIKREKEPEILPFPMMPAGFMFPKIIPIQIKGKLAPVVKLVTKSNYPGTRYGIGYKSATLKDPIFVTATDGLIPDRICTKFPKLDLHKIKSFDNPDRLLINKLSQLNDDVAAYIMHLFVKSEYIYEYGEIIKRTDPCGCIKHIHIDGSKLRNLITEYIDRFTLKRTEFAALLPILPEFDSCPSHMDDHRQIKKLIAHIATDIMMEIEQPHASEYYFAAYILKSVSAKKSSSTNMSSVGSQGT
jgi:hypothetical protein